MKFNFMQFFELIGVIVALIFILIIGYLIGKFIAQKQFKEEILEIREEAIKQSRAVLSGQFSEQLAPYLPGFPFKPTEARFIGKPIDFIIFKGMGNKKIDGVVFVEVKSGQSQLSKVERSLKETIQNKKVEWYEYKVDEGLTKEK